MAKKVRESTIDKTFSPEWRDVRGYEGLYRVSSSGDVWSVPRVAGRNRRKYGGRLLKQSRAAGTGYMRVTLSRGGKQNWLSVHSLVLSAFDRPRKLDEVCRHLDGNQLNNSIENLCWGSCRENMLDAIDHDTAAVGEKHGMAKICELDAWLIKNVDARIGGIADFFGLARSTVLGIRGGRSWRHI